MVWTMRPKRKTSLKTSEMFTFAWRRPTWRRLLGNPVRGSALSLPIGLIHPEPFGPWQGQRRRMLPPRIAETHPRRHSARSAHMSGASARMRSASCVSK